MAVNKLRATRARDAGSFATRNWRNGREAARLEGRGAIWTLSRICTLGQVFAADLLDNIEGNDVFPGSARGEQMAAELNRACVAPQHRSG